MRTQVCDVAGHVARTSDDELAPGHRKDRSRRLGRNARYITVDEIVEHQVPDAKDGLMGDEPERVFEAGHGSAGDDCAADDYAM